MKKLFLSACVAAHVLLADSCGAQSLRRPSFSGIYPHLAMYNREGECGTGAVVPWANQLWVITYGPHLPFGSSDKLYAISPDLQQTIRSESIGGTPANRMIHPESNQLFIGPYAIDAKGQVRTIPYTAMPGRHTGNARHLTDPAHKIYYGTMEEGFYEVDVQTLKPKLLYEDGNVNRQKDSDESNNLQNALLPGAHGKGLYSGQGVLVYSNNGEPGKRALEQFDVPAGSLSEWDGHGWKVVRRNQFVEVTGPGGIYGNKNPQADPIWATGWDHKSVLLGVRNPQTGWQFFRLPKASHSYDGAHGWNTEWPRIRDVGTPQQSDYLMTMHGLFWRFPATFTTANSAGIRPRSAYLKVIGDYTRWNNQLVFGCDDSAQKEFLNKRKVKGSIEGPAQSNSNLWFTSLQMPDELGPNTAEGAVWLQETVESASEPFLFAGWKHRSAWVQNHDSQEVTLTFEVDQKGTNTWTTLQKVVLAPGGSKHLTFTEKEVGEWIRIQPGTKAKLTAHFSYATPDTRSEKPQALFTGLSTVQSDRPVGGLLYGLGNDLKTMGMTAVRFENKQPVTTGYYEFNDQMQLVRKENPKMQSFITSKFAIPKNVVTVEESSVLIVDDQNRRWRLPLGADAFTDLTNQGALRLCREVATERDLFNCHGTFYELPAENADGFAKIRPVSSHNYRIHDFASYRGLLLLTGIDRAGASKNEHIIISEDQQAAVWAGTIDDLWKLGKPKGHGGPWKNTPVVAQQPSDPYLIGFYDQRSVQLSHQSSKTVTFTLEADPVGTGVWMPYQTFTVPAGKTITHSFPDAFQARWIRLKTDQNCTATALFDYK
ncbi:hypothetical protein BWI97_20590 [Siphonobacter sp. BAB-5405]|uniref:hypothetical protein n=1 Tax=Siphonobacter sp. BAB-5405 TaxID=1864825 RepID=UPI000C7FBD1E|nr:hypothetical protein [Siphonobacter sp. BAB-5405]PMD92580.1 hypothetical protein BWI97_20590 [Siphonobacter sp. BAB-5405]